MKKRHSHNFVDLKEKVFGRLTVLEEVGVVNYQPIWKCRCECGNFTMVSSGALKSGGTKSCGCLKRELLVKKNTKHGMTSGPKKHRLYIVWAGMLQRCFNKNELAYKNYGARGITVCDEWKSFEAFKDWAISNGYRNDLEIDRQNNNGNYEPSNCRWVTVSENQLNKRNNHRITINGITKTITEWSKISGISIHTIESRIRYGWKSSDLLKPVGLYEKNKQRDRDPKTGRYLSKTKG